MTSVHIFLICEYRKVATLPLKTSAMKSDYGVEYREFIGLL